MSNTWAYCRISTPKQSIDRQIRNAKAFAPGLYCGAGNLYWNKIPGSGVVSEDDPEGEAR